MNLTSWGRVMRETLSIAVLMIFLAVAGGGQSGTVTSPSCKAPLTLTSPDGACLSLPLSARPWPQPDDAQAFRLAVLR